MSSLYRAEMESSYFEAMLVNQPTRIITAGITDTQTFFLAIFNAKLRMPHRLLAHYHQLRTYYLLSADAEPLVPKNTSIPMMFLQPALRDQGWVGEAELGGIVTDACPGNYVIKIEIIDISLICNGQASTAIVKTVFTQPVKFV
ncbi:uncharacterized protein I303_100313 [Kwoniella dejecticola CBS 10117]|uniref:Uncharacterized protein n=1 Tax=Kwoniella dejecticola CBS 10117 TaxID=1296121 RepID=A0A1A6AEJ8_9TREE|nr:uncharacterized protein I303_00313 [Kwoniella dejecticola CBS 10117]OBR88496.1 hypothetical protein I303_00313 [Kwoniella dejecticola CBS 10117]